MAISALGWVATGIFAVSYLFKRPATLRKVQAAAACLWILYGIAIGAMPVIVANLIVAGAALYSSFFGLRSNEKDCASQTQSESSGESLHTKRTTEIAPALESSAVAEIRLKSPASVSTQHLASEYLF